MSKGSQACVSFLKWALPKMDLRWEGYKKVRGQVCTRINKRLKELNLEDYDAYKNYLEKHQEEWDKLDGMSHITISRFFRDKKQWEVLEHKLLPELLEKEEMEKIRVWSAGCASGEEPYSFAILWENAMAFDFPDMDLEIIATDADEHMLKRAKETKFSKGSLKELPSEWKQQSFQKKNNFYHLKEKYREKIQFRQQDIRKEMPEGPFDIIFCKNLVAMYFDKNLAVKLFQKISDRMKSGAYLLLGNHEEFPLEEMKEITLIDQGINLYMKK